MSNREFFWGQRTAEILSQELMIARRIESAGGQTLHLLGVGALGFPQGAGGVCPFEIPAAAPISGSCPASIESRLLRKFREMSGRTR
jgi:hypothetical protein